MQSDKDYYDELYRSAATQRTDEQTPGRSAARRGMAGARLRGSGRGRGGARPPPTATEKDSALPRVNGYGRQMASSSVSGFDKGGQYPDPTPVLPAKRRRTEMTEMLYGDDFPMKQVSKVPARIADRARSPPLPESQFTAEFSDFEAAGPASFAESDVTVSQAAEGSITQMPETRFYRGEKYTRQQLRGPATAAGLPAFPHHSAPQAPPVVVSALKPAFATSGTVPFISLVCATRCLGPSLRRTRITYGNSRATGSLRASPTPFWNESARLRPSVTYARWPEIVFRHGAATAARSSVTNVKSAYPQRTHELRIIASSGTTVVSMRTLGCEMRRSF